MNEAERLRHDRVGTGHLLVGLLQVEGTITAATFSGSGLSVEAAQDALQQLSGFGEKDVSAKPFTPAAKKVLERASETALDYGKNYVGDEHLLLAILEDPESTAARMLDASGVDRTKFKAEITAAIEKRDY